MNTCKYNLLLEILSVIAIKLKSKVIVKETLSSLIFYNHAAYQRSSPVKWLQSPTLFFVWTPSRHRGDTWLITTVSCVQSPSPGRRTWSATWNDTSTKERPRPVTLGTLTYRLRSRVMNTHTVSAHGSLSLPVLTSVSSDPTSQQSTLTNHLILRVVSWGQT